MNTINHYKAPGSERALTVHMMTASLSPGDAIGNYIASLTAILRGWGCTVKLYADHPNDRYPLPHYHSSAYHPTGRDLLWLHYSIYTDNIRWLRESPDFKLLDSHNVTPSQFFRGYDSHMEWLCAEGNRLLDTFSDSVDLAVVHTDYVRRDLARRGYRRIHKLPLVVDTARFTGEGSPVWEPLLSHLQYLLFVGRIVPQKNLEGALKIFAALQRRRPQSKFFLVGSKSLPKYLHELEALAAELGIADNVIFTGPIAEPDVLTSFYRHARFYLALSAWESFCVPIVESHYFGTPVLAHDVPPMPETMGSGGVVLEGSAEQMAAHIDELWGDDVRYEQLQQHGYAHTAQFTDGQLRATLLRLFRELGEGR